LLAGVLRMPLRVPCLSIPPPECDTTRYPAFLSVFSSFLLSTKPGRAQNERMDAMYRFHQEKRIKPGLAITQRHIRLCDRHLRAAGVSSRNEFVEKAIECYAGWLDVKQNPEFFRELFGPDIGR
ncbi:hypothetical protein, partial [Ruthenibacterium lactatiformans]|uniref:hypothetical protein n=4 Tax=Ruthenibacterium lactatiformans TaxID=1550024 RepID=UPI003AF08E9D